MEHYGPRFTPDWGSDVPIYPTMTEDDYEYIFNHSESKYCFVSNDELYDKVTNVLPKCKGMKKVFSFEKYKGRNHWSEVMDLGKNSDKHEEVQNHGCCAT